MVLDTYRPEQELFIFKNTYNDEINGQPKRFEIGRNEDNAPEEFFFVHIDVRDMDKLPSQNQREANKEAEMKMKKKKFRAKNKLWSFCCCL